MTARALTNRGLLDDYLKNLSRTRSASTVYIYSKDLEKFLGHLGDTHVLHASPRDMQQWLDRPRAKKRGQPASAATIRRETMELRSFYAFLVEQRELLSASPAAKIDLPRVDNELPHPVPQDEWLRWWRRGDLSDDLRVATGLGYFCGLRRHEVTLLSPSQFVWEPQLTILDLKRKGHKANRPFYVGSCLLLHQRDLGHLIGDTNDTFLRPLRRLLAERKDEPTLLPWDGRDSRYATRTRWQRPEGLIDPTTFNRRLEQACAGFTPHSLRHSFGTNMVRPRPAGCGVPIQVVTKLMNHSDPRITMRYLDVGADPLADLLACEDGPKSTDEYGPWGKA